MAVDELQPGEEIAGHRIVGVAGRGGMGVVYRALQLDLERPVALKLIATALADDEDFRSRFVREARAAAAIDHPNVIPVYSAGEDRGRLYLAMRLVEGDDLRGRVRRAGALAPAAAAAIVAQVAAALDAAHARGLVHRDVKPANVLLDGEHAYLTDFGLTKRVSAGEASVTGAGRWVGTLGYVAPEQLRDLPVDARTDVYALGCVLHFALTGVAPHRRESDEATLLAALHDPPADPREVVPDLPGALAAVVLRALEKDPADRFPSAGDLGRAALAATGAGPDPGPERTVARGAAAPASEAPTRAAGGAVTAVASEGATVVAGGAAVGPGGAAAGPSGVARRRRPWLLGGGALLAGAAIAVALVLALRDDGGTGGPVTPAATTGTTPAGAVRVTETVRVDARPNGATYLRGRVWVSGGRSGRLIGLSTGDADPREIKLPWSSGTRALTAGFGSLWVVNGPESRLIRIDPVDGHLQASVPLTPGDVISVASGAGSVWVGRRRGRAAGSAPDSLIKIDPATNQVETELVFGEEGIGSVAAGGGQVYVTNRFRDRVSRVDPTTGERHSTPVGRDPRGVSYGAGAVWVTSFGAGTLTQFTPGLRNPFAAATGSGPVGVAVGSDAVWVANQLDSTVVRLDRRTGRRLGAPVTVGRNPFAVVAHGTTAWVTSLADGTVSRLQG